MAEERARVVLTLPSDTVSELWGSPAAAERDIIERVVLGLFAEGRLAAGRAARLLGITYADFMELLARRKVPWPYGPEDLHQDIETMRRLDKR